MAVLVVAGAINWDISLFVRKFPGPGEETAVARVTRVAGGKGGNVAAAAARLLGSHQVAIIGALGTDDIGREQIRLLEDEGVNTHAIARKAGEESGQAYIIVEESGENKIHTYFGANASLSPDDVLADATRQTVQSAKIVAVSDPPEEAIKSIVQAAYTARRKIAWDPGVRSEAGIVRLREVLARINYLFLNEAEVEYMTGSRDQLKAASRLSKINPTLTLIMKLGKEGCAVSREGRVVRIPGIDVQKYGMRVVNTVGCGDAFFGAFSAAKAIDLSDQDALQWANWAGALKATKQETRGSPKLEELKKWVT